MCIISRIVSHLFRDYVYAKKSQFLQGVCFWVVREVVFTQTKAVIVYATANREHIDTQIVGGILQGVIFANEIPVCIVRKDIPPYVLSCP
jgi:hypothetical protein